MHAELTKDVAIDWPTEDSTRIPYQVFTDPDLYDLEQATLFRGANWCFVGLDIEIPKTGDFKTTHVGDTPVLVVRNADGQIHCMVNL